MNGNSAKGFILILNLNQGSRGLLEKRLAKMGFDCAWVGSSDDTIRFLNEADRQPDLILTELAHADPKAMQLPSLIRSQTRFGKSIPLAIHTAIADRGVVVEALRSGFSDYLIRPMEPEVFEDRISKLIVKTSDLDAKTFLRPIREHSTLGLSIDLEQINEFGLRARCPFSPPVGEILPLDSALLKSIGLSLPVRVRVLSSESSAAARGSFEVQLSFVGLNPAELRQLRQFAMAPPSHSA